MAGPLTEYVLCVPRDELFPDQACERDQPEGTQPEPGHEMSASGRFCSSHGFVRDGLGHAQEVIQERSFFMPRGDVEADPAYQQIIPYVVFRHRDRYLLTRRLQASTEERLRQRYSLGVGGHINPGDLAAGDPITDGLRREWEEEVVYRGDFQARLLGLLNDDSSPVSRVHLGIVFLVDGDTPEITIREQDKLSGELLTLDEMRIYYLEMESWSQLVYDHLVTGAV